MVVAKSATTVAVVVTCLVVLAVEVVMMPNSSLSCQRDRVEEKKMKKMVVSNHGILLFPLFASLNFPVKKGRNIKKEVPINPYTLINFLPKKNPKNCLFGGQKEKGMKG